MRFLNILSISRSFPLRVFTFLFIAGVFLIPQPAEAIPFLTEAVSLVSVALISFFSLIMNIQGAVINWLVNPAGWGAAFTHNPTVVSGWRIMRDFANLGFALAIIVIAIGFILRIQTYGSQRTLTRLIIAAIMVNFSLAIAGVFIDAANIISRFFLAQFNIVNIWGSLINASGVANLFMTAPDRPLMQVVWDFIIRAVPFVGIPAAINVLIQTLITSVFSLMMIAALGALIVMLLIRVAHIWVLLILAPIAWVMWIFPAFENNWKRWWEEFIRWTFFAPIVIFFLGFSLAILGSPAARPPEFLGASTTILAQTFDAAMQAAGLNRPITDTIARFTIAITMMVLSMIIANQMGISFAKQGVQWATTVGKWPGLAAWRGGLKESKGRFATSSLGKALEERFARSRIPGVGAFADSLRGIRTKVEDDSKKSADRYKILSSEQIGQDLANPQKRAMMSQADLLARARVLNDRGEQLPDSIADTVLQTAHNTNPKFAEQFLPTNPQLVKRYEATIARRPEGKRRTITDYTRKMTTEQAENIKASMLEGLSAPDRALFASGMQQSVLAHMLDKNHESGVKLLEVLRNTTELQKQLQSSDIAKDQIAPTLKKVQGMLKSPQIAHWVPGEAEKASEPKVTNEELERLLGTKRKASK